MALREVDAAQVARHFALGERARLTGPVARGQLGQVWRLEAASGFMHKVYSPVGLTIATLINGMVVTVIIALIVAIFFQKRSAQGELLASAEPPAVPPSV